MRLRWTEDAINDIASIRSYIEKDKPRAAKAVVKKILAATEKLIEYPDAGRPGRIPGTRELAIATTPYIIPYRVRGEFVDLLRVFHGAMRWPDKL